MSTVKNIHKSGAIRRMLNSGNVRKMEDDDDLPAPEAVYQTNAGIEFKENELISVDPAECIPWKYANRLDNELGNFDELIKSIQDQGQLQPALVRPVAESKEKTKYEIIFGRRRYEACLKLNIPLLVIVKNISDIKEALMYQDAENKHRKNVSNYSNAILYARLITDKVFKSEKELSEKLGVSYMALRDLLSYSKIPSDIVNLIPDIHSLSIAMSSKIITLSNKSELFYSKILKIAPKIGKEITTPGKLEKIIVSLPENEVSDLINKTKIYTSSAGKKLFTFRVDFKGSPCILINKDLEQHINYEKMCEYFKRFLEEHTDSVTKI